MQGIRIYGAPLSQPTRAVLWVCNILNLKYEFVHLDTVKGDHRQDSFLKMNPNAKFPVLQIDDFVLYESHAIMKYLVRKSGVETTLYPSSLEEQAIVDSWLDWKHSHLRIGAAGLIRRRVMSKLMKDYSKHSMAADLKEIPEEREIRFLLDSLNIMESRLSTTKYLGGGASPTIADISLVCEIEQLSMFPDNLEPPFGSNFAPKFPHLQKWQQEMRTLPGYQESHKGLLAALKGIAKMRAKNANL